MWIRGDQSLRDMRLWGIVQIFWLGRAGKVFAWFSAAVIILDIIGPQRLRDFEDHRRARHSASQTSPGWLHRALINVAYFGTSLAVAAAFVYEVGFHPEHGFVRVALLFIVLLAACVLMMSILLNINKWAIWIFERDRPARVARLASYLFLTVGALLDALVS